MLLFGGTLALKNRTRSNGIDVSYGNPLDNKMTSTPTTNRKVIAKRCSIIKRANNRTA